jgi:hypothetical protein
MRRQLTTSDPSGFRVHDHVAWCGDGPHALDRLAVSTFSAAVGRGELMMFVSDAPDPLQLVGLAHLDALVTNGALQLASIEDTYRDFSDPTAQRRVFDVVVDAALADGYSGVCVVADNSSMAAGSDDDFAAWLGWEATADDLQATRPVTGVCYFDRQRVPPERMADLATMHPVLSADIAAPTFQLYVDGDTVRVSGAVDFFSVEQLRRILDDAPKLTDRILDLSDVEYVHHRALLSLNELATEGRTVRLKTQSIVRNMWSLLDMPSAALEFC